MLSLALPRRIFVCTLPADMRKSFDGLAALVRDHLDCDPLSGDLFVFRSKRGDRIKLLYWNEDGYALWYRRLEAGTFAWPTLTPSRTAVVPLTHSVAVAKPADVCSADGYDDRVLVGSSRSGLSHARSRDALLRQTAKEAISIALSPDISNAVQQRRSQSFATSC